MNFPLSIAVAAAMAMLLPRLDAQAGDAVRGSFSWEVTHEISTGTDHRLRTRLFRIEQTRVTYSERDQIRGSTAPRVLQEAFTNREELDPGIQSEFFRRLEEADLAGIPPTRPWNPDKPRIGVLEGERTTYRVSGRVSGDFTVASYIDDLPAEVEPIKALVDELITRLHLDVPPRPDEIAIMVGPSRGQLHVRTEEPVWNPWFYHGKTIAGIDRQPDGVIEIRLLEHPDVVLRGESTLPDARLAGFEDGRIRSLGTRRTRLASEGDLQPAREVTLREVLDDPDSFHGKRIAVSGHYRGEFESSRLATTREASEEREYENSVWVTGPSTFAEQEDVAVWSGFQLSDEPPHPVVVEGVFIKGPGGHFNLWPGEIRRLTVFRRNE